MNGTYSLELVSLSIVVAIIAAYTALDLAARVTDASARRATLWVICGALALGIGIWSMHFIGMLAFEMPIPIAYDPTITVLSMGIAVLVSGFALYTLRRRELAAARLTVSATLMGIGICAMHYTGMLAMRMSPPIEYTPSLFVASVLIAIGASFAALLIAFHLRYKKSGLAILARVGSAVVMGLAISGMHYTGMAAAEFAPGAVCLAAESQGALHPSSLGVWVGVTTLVILLGTLVLSSMDSHTAVRTAGLVETLQHEYQELRTVAMYDPLTGVPNRLLLQDRLEQAVRRAQRSDKRFAVMFLDLDRFKSVNDTHGHAVGDLLLRQVATRLCRAVRKEDTVARTGGDEFVIVLAEVKSRCDAEAVGSKIVAELNHPFEVESHVLDISSSVGISLFPDHAQDIPGLLKAADAAMYEIKNSGRNGVRSFGAEPAPAQC